MRLSGLGVIALLGLVALGPGAGAAGALETGVPPQLSEAESELVARAGAERALAGFVAPADAISSPVEPAGDARRLPPPSSQPGAQVVQLARWWLAPESLAQAIGGLPTPAGSQVEFRINPSGMAGRTSGAGFDWPAVPGARGQLRLEIEAVALDDGRTEIRAVAQGFWRIPRPAGEAIAPGMRLLRITVAPDSDGLSGGRVIRTHQRPLTVENGQRIERVVRLINSLPAAQEPAVARLCPPPTGGVTLRLAFYEHPHGDPSAVLSDNLVACGGVGLFLAGRQGAGLQEEGELPREISEAIERPIDVEHTTAPPGRGGGA